MTRVSLVVLILVAIGSAIGVALQHWRAGDPTRPPSPENKAAWEWVAAEDGANIYVSPVDTPGPRSLAFAWITREFSRGPASVGGNVVELRQFDCARRTSRRVSASRLVRNLNGADPLHTTGGASAWRPVPPGSAAEQVLYAACANRGQQPVTMQKNVGGRRR